jgi:uncharacterized protein (TIGR02246 family)
LALAATVAGAKTRSPNVDERGIVAADRAWGYAATAKDLDQTLSFYAEDAVLLAPNAPAAEGRPAIRAFWSAEFKDPAYSLSWHTDTVTVARSGELGYARGSYDATYTAEGRAVREHGKFLVIWKKVPGAWLVAADMFSPDAPPTPTNP